MKKLDIKEARTLHEAGQFDAAKKMYLALLKKNPANVDALHLLGILSAQQDNFSEAIRYLETAVKHQPHNPNLNLHLANLLKAQGLFSQAAQVLHTLIELNPQYVAAYNNLGTVYYALGKYFDAVHFYRLAIQKQTNYIDAYYNLGLALIKLNQWTESVSAFQSVLTHAPKHAPAQFQLGRVFMLQEKWNDAIQAFLAIEQDHPFHFETLTNIATCYLREGALREAKIHYSNALKLRPEDTQILFNLGVINAQQENMDEAIQFYQRAVYINPDFFEAHNNLGVAFLAKKHVAFALHHFQEALRLQPKNEAARYTVQMLSHDRRLFASPPDYIKNLFDFYADHYEAHLLKALDYKVPELLFRAVTTVKKLSPQSCDILDLGCGTGLCGVPFKPFAKTLVGVDLSEKMLAMAALKNIYDELISSDLNTFLQNKKDSYDLVLAGDVFVYIGDLEKLFSALHHALRPGGLLVFNAEISMSDPFIMNQSGRFAHLKSYLEALAAKNSFQLLFYEEVVTRLQNNEPVLGHLIVFSK